MYTALFCDFYGRDNDVAMASQRNNKGHIGPLIKSLRLSTYKKALIHLTLDGMLAMFLGLVVSSCKESDFLVSKEFALVPHLRLFFIIDSTMN